MADYGFEDMGEEMPMRSETPMAEEGTPEYEESISLPLSAFREPPEEGDVLSVRVVNIGNGRVEVTINERPEPESESDPEDYPEPNAEIDAMAAPA